VVSLNFAHPVCQRCQWNDVH